jgi:hypothetical protein
LALDDEGADPLTLGRVEPYGPLIINQRKTDKMMTETTTPADSSALLRDLAAGMKSTLRKQAIEHIREQLWSEAETAEEAAKAAKGGKGR